VQSLSAETQRGLGQANWEGAKKLATIPIARAPRVATFAARLFRSRKAAAAAEPIIGDHAERIRRLVRDCSHELRTPITIAKGHAELLQQACRDPQGADDDEMVGDVEVILGELDRLSRLTDRLLVVAAAGDPGFLALDRIDVEPVMVALARRWSAAADRTWKVSVDGDHWILADSGRLTAALDALIENAVFHTVDGDEIAIEVRSTRGCVVITIRDAGCGIPARRLVWLLDQPSTAGLRRPGGTGLGIAIVKTITEAHGGWVTVESQAGRGTAFSLHLPRAVSLESRGSNPVSY
jgi:two-component system, OmpR family, sensor kinase